MPQVMLDKFQNFLYKQGLRLTGQRELIARTFFLNKGHLSAEELHHQVQKSSPGIGYATVYRTIKLLSHAGLAAGRSFGNGFARYEPSAQSEHHDHLICRNCGKIVEFENDRIEALQKAVAREHGFQVTEHTMELYGICGNCRENNG
jgi:Fur family ferric uptake transcriptional regulator